jgi:hypothetical protein
MAPSKRNPTLSGETMSAMNRGMPHREDADFDRSGGELIVRLDDTQLRFVGTRGEHSVTTDAGPYAVTSGRLASAPAIRCASRWSPCECVTRMASSPLRRLAGRRRRPDRPPAEYFPCVLLRSHDPRT